MHSKLLKMEYIFLFIYLYFIYFILLLPQFKQNKFRTCLGLVAAALIKLTNQLLNPPEASLWITWIFQIFKHHFLFQKINKWISTLKKAQSWITLTLLAPKIRSSLGLHFRQSLFSYKPKWIIKHVRSIKYKCLIAKKNRTNVI